MKIFCLVFSCCLFISCSSGDQQAKKVADVLVTENSCLPAKDLMWKIFYGLAEDQVAIQASESFKSLLEAEVKAAFPTWFANEKQSLVHNFLEEFVLLFEKLAAIQETQGFSSWLKVLAQSELEVEDSILSEKVTSEIHVHIQKNADLLNQLRPKCLEEVVATSPEKERGLGLKGAFITRLKRKHHPLLYGAKKVLLTAYQDCQIEERTSPFDRRTPNVQGIKRLAVGHPNGIGGRRVIEDSDLLYKTHPYYGYRTGGATELNSLFAGENQCLNQSHFLMIYDYGGKPSTSSKANSSLNLFKHAVDAASPDLGVDCSGYVFSAIAAAGLKLHPDKQLIASQVYGVSANHFRKSSKKVMPCFDKVLMTERSNLRDGDIISTKGHTLIVGGVGKDPLAIKKYARNDRCTKISYKDFDFDVYQSSPAKGALGIHVMQAKEHLRQSKSMRVPLVELAQKICQKSRANQKQKSEIQNGSFELSIIRHSGSPSCMSSEVSLVAESCLKECR